MDGSTAEGAAAAVQQALNQISSKDWRDRITGLKSMAGASSAVPGIADSLLMNLIDQITHRLSDGNSKVIVAALETLKVLFSRAGDRLLLGLNTVIPALASNLGSTSEKIRYSAAEVLDKLLEVADHVLLIQNFSHCIGHGNLRGKAVLLEKLLEIVINVYPRKPQLVVKHTLPVAFAMMNESRADVRAANVKLIVALGRLMGVQILGYAGNLSLASRERLREILRDHQLCCSDEGHGFGVVL